MADEYPLKDLLRVRKLRSDGAQRELTGAMAAARQARSLVEQRRAALETWQTWKVEEVERRYESILGHAMSVEALQSFREGLAKLDEETVQREVDVDEAEEARKAADEVVERARVRVAEAKKGEAKIEAHRDIWLAQEKVAAERAQDREFEEFRSVKPTEG